MAGEKTKQIGVAHQHKHNRNKQNRKKQNKKELESQPQQQHGNTTLAFLHRVSLMDEMCVCSSLSFAFLSSPPALFFFISFLFDYDLSFVCVAVGDAIDESGIKVALGFYGQK